MYRLFIQEGVELERPEVEEANEEFSAAIRLVIAKGIYENREIEEELVIDEEALERTQIGKMADLRTLKETRTPKKIFVRVNDGRMAIDSTAICLWQKKLWVMVRGEKWIILKEIHPEHRREITEAAEAREEELTKIMLNIGQDNVSHILLEKRLREMFPKKIGGINQGVSSFQQQFNRKQRRHYPYKWEWKGGEDITAYEKLEIEERTGRALNHLWRIDKMSKGEEKLRLLSELYHKLRGLITVKRRNFTSTLQKRLIIPLPIDGNVNQEDREVTLTHQFGIEEQRSPLRSALCIKFLEDLIRVMRTSEGRQYGERDAAHLACNNIEGRLAKEMEELTYQEIANTLIQRFVHIDPTATLREVIGARKPFGQTWDEYIEYITSVVEQVVPANRDQKKTQKQLIRTINS